jgi:RNA polymerase sigma-70 factor (ECF subfamily)
MPDPSPEVIATLLENHRRFRSFLELRVENASDAEDILQTAFLRSVEKGDMIREQESVVAWFYRLLRHAIVDHYRHRGAEGRALQRAAGFEHDVDEPVPEVEQAICRCIHDVLPTLSSDYGTLLKRVDLEGATIAEVAAETGMTPNNVRVRLHRARQALRTQLERTCGSCTEHACLDCTCRRPGHQPP